MFKALAPNSHSHNYDDEARCLCILTAALGGRQVQCDRPHFTDAEVDGWAGKGHTQSFWSLVLCSCH